MFPVFAYESLFPEFPVEPLWPMLTLNKYKNYIKMLPPSSTNTQTMNVFCRHQLCRLVFFWNSRKTPSYVFSGEWLMNLLSQRGQQDCHSAKQCRRRLKLWNESESILSCLSVTFNTFPIVTALDLNRLTGSNQLMCYTHRKTLSK